MRSNRLRTALVDPPMGGGQRGFSLIEAIVATAIAVIAVLGMAHTFGMGRALVSRYEIGRAALGVAQARLEGFASHTPAAIVTPAADSVAFIYKGVTRGMEVWTVAWEDDPSDGTGGADTNGPNDLKRVTVQVHWGIGDDVNRVTLTRLISGL
jgi:prepilin-type N-terminal cleavage/methylation domain-containing protein